MTTTPRGATELAASQAVPETTVNQQVRHTEAGACHFPVTDRITTPPGTCADGANYIITATATGAWVGKENQIATAVGTNAASGWLYHVPVEGFTAYVQDENASYLFDGAAWAASSSGYTDEQARDAVGAALVAGANITITVNDGGDTITLAAAGGGGAGSFDLSEYTSTSPTAPATGLTIFDRKRAGTHHFAARSPLASDEYQKRLATRTFKMWQGAGNTTPSTIGILRSVISGASYDSPTSTSIRTRMNRIKFQTSGTAGTQAGETETASAFSLCITGGFECVFRWSHSLIANSGYRQFIGLSTSTSPGNVDPSSLVNMLGFGSDAGDSNYHFMHNDAAGTATKVDLGANFPAATNDAVYEGRIFVEPGGSTVYYSLERFDSAQFTESSATTNLPVSTTMLGYIWWVNNGAVAANANIEVNKFWAETPY